MAKIGMQRVVVVLGQTATGKSALAVCLAKRFNAEIISADSRQVYNGLDIGTGKITGREMKGIPHHMIDIVSPKKQFTVSEYKSLSEKIMKNILKRGKVPIICGGTGLYIDALINGLVIPEVPPNSKLREKLKGKSEKYLNETLKILDPRRAKEIDRQNPRRLIRAIEIARALGRVPRYKLKATTYNLLKIGLKLPDGELRRKIHIRLLARIREGMVGEAKRLHKNGLSWKRMEALGLEYKYLAKYLKNEMSKQEMLSNLETEIWRYAKRQNTWFKRDKDIKWFTPKERSKIIKEVNGFVKKCTN